MSGNFCSLTSQGEADAQKAWSLAQCFYLVKSEYNPKQVVEKVEEIVKASTRGEASPK